MKAEDIRRGGPVPIPKNGEAKKAVPKKAAPAPVQKVVQTMRPIPSSGPLQKIPWPGDWAIVKAAAYANGVSKDKSGIDSINHWATTATQEEVDQMLRHAEAMGWLTGFGVGLPVFSAIRRFFQG